jgi:predicted metal-binding membrane protein
MVAMVLVGMTSLGWTIILAALVLAHKFAPPAAWRLDVVLAALVPVISIVTPR